MNNLLSHFLLHITVPYILCGCEQNIIVYYYYVASSYSRLW